MSDCIRVGVVSLGCSKNRVDTEQMLAVLQRAGYCITTDIERAQVVIINTCAFIQSAKEESIDTILEIAQRKNRDAHMKIIVTGCLPQRYRETLSKELPEVDGWIGVNQYGMIDTIVKQVIRGGYSEEYDMYCAPPPDRILSTPSHLAYVKIAEGCDHRCSYCAIPSIRGPYRSRPLDEIVRECRQLKKQGVREIVLIAQDTSYYGKDLYGHLALPELLKALDGIDIPWIRLLYTYPERVDDTLLDAMEKTDSIIPYLDMPLQHISDEVLQKMGRGMTENSTRTLLARIRNRKTRFTLRTTFIAGFPGETKEQHQQLVRFIEEAGFDHVGVFAYSQEEGTRAAKMQGQWDAKTKTRRRDALLAAQQKTAYGLKQARIGNEVDVIIESVDASGQGKGRTKWQAPDVDGVVYIGDCEASDIGRIVSCRITRADAYDYWGTWIR